MKALKDDDDKDVKSPIRMQNILCEDVCIMKSTFITI